MYSCTYLCKILCPCTCTCMFYVYREPEGLKLLIKLYVERSYSVWKEPEVYTCKYTCTIFTCTCTCLQLLAVHVCACIFVCHYTYIFRCSHGWRLTAEWQSLELTKKTPSYQSTEKGQCGVTFCFCFFVSTLLDPGSHYLCLVVFIYITELPRGILVSQGIFIVIFSYLIWTV